jgi:hypothetical protein
MKLREVESVPQGTSFVLNFTHPELVCRRLSPSGVGT